MSGKSDNTSIPTRQTLLKRLKNLEDHESWEDFYNTYWRLIYAMAMKAGLSAAEAQDVVQETLISVTKKIGAYKADPLYGSFKSWLLLITRRRIADQFRKRPAGINPSLRRAGETTQTPTAERIPDPASLDWEAIWEDQWKKNLVEAAMQRVKEQVSPKEYLLFYQQTVKEWPVSKVATQYNASRASVYMAKYRVSKLIKAEVERLEKAGVENLCR